MRKTYFLAVGVLTCVTAGAVGAAYCLTTVPPLAPVVLAIGFIAAKCLATKWLANWSESTKKILEIKQGQLSPINTVDTQQASLDERRLRISEGVKTAEHAQELEQYIETTDDLLHLLNERAAFACEKALESNREDYFDNDLFLNPLFNPGAPMGQRIANKFQINLVEFAVRNINDPLNRKYLACAFFHSDIHIMGSNLSIDEIIAFLKDIVVLNLLEKHGSRAYCFGRQTDHIFTGVWNYIFPAGGASRGYTPLEVTNEVNARRTQIFNAYLAETITVDQFLEYIMRCIRHHDPVLLKVLFDLGNQKPELWQNEEFRKYDTTAILDLLKATNTKSVFSDYHELKASIELLIEYEFLELEQLGVSSTHALIMRDFLPCEYVAVHMLQSPLCDLETLKLFLEPKSFMFFLDRAEEAIKNPKENEAILRGTDFLFKHYIELNTYLRDVLSPILNTEKYEHFKKLIQY
jgi:hypothetical protein